MLYPESSLMEGTHTYSYLTASPWCAAAGLQSYLSAQMVKRFMSQTRQPKLIDTLWKEIDKNTFLDHPKSVHLHEASGVKQETGITMKRHRQSHQDTAVCSVLKEGN